ncbi:TPA: 50S ribosomal protein L24 [Candidatus Micrarchaeota archaeon]|nr:50S ribosomal protein L24P [uncultured archaeon]HIH19703.1 50S ribosomal protein L24 [Candidatus Micrarchaeota archaeon]
MKFSNSVSSKPRKKRRAMYHAPLHLKQKLVAVHLSRDLRKQLKKRAMPVRKGDKVLVLNGKFKKREGIVSRVDLKNSLVFVGEIVLKKQSGKEVLAPLRPSHLVLLQLVERKRKAKKQKPAAAQAVQAGQANKTN